VDDDVGTFGAEQGQERVAIEGIDDGGPRSEAL
jgi:hypothetical protein